MVEKQFYFVAPIEAVKVTASNLEEVAEWCGGKVMESESKRYPGVMEKYVWVPTPKGTKLSWAYPGMLVTQRLTVSTRGEIKSVWSVFFRDYFEKNYFLTQSEASEATWVADFKKREVDAALKMYRASKANGQDASSEAEDAV